MSNNEGALSALYLAKEEIIRELNRAGESGGSGLALRYAPQLVHLDAAIESIKALDTPSFAEKMAAAKAAKKAANAV